MTRTNLAYHFTGDTLRDGSPIPPIGEWLEHEGDVKLCESGLHFSRHPFDALTYAPGSLLHLVEVDYIEEEDTDKGVCRGRKIVATIDAKKLLRECARKWALDVIDEWPAPDVVVQWLNTGDESLRSRAESAAWSAARSSAWSAAGSAAGSAARSAAWSAARSSAWSAADAASLIAAQREYFAQKVNEAFNKEKENNDDTN